MTLAENGTTPAGGDPRLTLPPPTYRPNPVVYKSIPAHNARSQNAMRAAPTCTADFFKDKYY